MVLFHGLVHAVGDMNSEKLSPIAQTARNMHLQREQFAREDEEKRLQQQNRLTQEQINYAATEAAQEASVAQVSALVKALRSVAPNHHLLRENGRIDKSGRRMTNLRALWIQKFDESIIQKLGNYAGDPSRFRGV